METRRTAVQLILFVCAFFVTRSDAQCGDLVTVTDSGDVLVNRNIPRFCLQCEDAVLGLRDTNWFLGADGILSPTRDPNPSAYELVNNSILVLLDPITLLEDAPSFFRVECIAYTFTLNLYSDVAVPPRITVGAATTSTITIIEGGTDSVDARCADENPPPIRRTGGRDFWYGPDGNVPSFADNAFLSLPSSLTRTQAGDYTCRIDSTRGDITSTFVTVIVQFPPEATTTELASQEVILGTSLSLTCNFVGVPTPSASWTQNGTDVDTLDSRVSIATTTDSSTLTITEVDRDGGGLYVCIFNNTIANQANFDTVNVTSVLILVPPDAATNLTADPELVGQRQIPITWINGFDGNAPIQRAEVEYSEMGANVPGSDPTSYLIEGLDPFVVYNISVYLVNVAGRSEAVSIAVKTRSLLLEPPVDVMITTLNSTSLQVDWDAPADEGTAAPRSWFIEISELDGRNPMNDTTDAATRTVDFYGLDKGTMYRVTVAGSNVAGQGRFSSFENGMTAVDPPSEPEEVRVEGVSSFALRVSWSLPADSGGSPVTNYYVQVVGVANATARVGVDFEVLIRSNDLMEGTNYNVMVAAINVAGTGENATASGSTISILEPQPLLDEPVPSEVVNISITLNWDDPGGDVLEYVIQYRQTEPGFETMLFNVSVNGNETEQVLEDLRPGSTYSVVIFTINALGTAIASPAALFDTALPPPPVITGDTPVPKGSSPVLTCSSPDLSRDIEWSIRRDSTEGEDMELVPPIYAVNGLRGVSTLTIREIGEDQVGVYVCRVGRTMDDFEIGVIPDATTSTTPSSGFSEPVISTTIIIVVACVGGVILLLVLAAIVFAICCFCLRGSRQKTGSYGGNSGIKPDKRTKELFDVSMNASYLPVRSQPAASQDADVSFDIPEDFQAHSSFNTLDKANKHSTSPEVAPIAGYQDMPPSYDSPGTVL